MSESRIDIDPIPEGEVFHDDLSLDSLVDFEIAFFMLILTIVLAYPTENDISYQILKFLMVLFAALTLIRRILIMNGSENTHSAFMAASIEFMVEISILGILYVIAKVAFLIQDLVYFNYVLWLFILSIATIFVPIALQIKYAKTEQILFNIVIASWQANTSDTALWRRIQQNRAIKEAHKLSKPDEELPNSVVQLRQKEPETIVPRPGETAQAFVGLTRWLALRSFGVVWGAAVFGSLGVSLLIFVSATSIGASTNRLYKQFGAASFRKQSQIRYRVLFQNLTVLFAHLIILG
ncbi:hypothetical protein HTG_16865 [Natrinema mahii]|nr:hypothetical protein HTG_16865 [Natrinema mahii]